MLCRPLAQLSPSSTAGASTFDDPLLPAPSLKKTPRGIDIRDKSKRAGAKSLTAFDWISVSPGWNVRCKGGRCSCIDSASGLRDNNTHSLANRLTLSPEESWVSWGGEWETSNKQPQPLRLHGPTQLDPALCRVPSHYYCTTSWAFITSLILTQKLHFSGTLRFCFFVFPFFFFHLFLCSFFGQEHKQIYTTGVFCLCLNVVKSVSQKWDCRVLTLLFPGMKASAAGKGIEARLPVVWFPA